MCRICATCAEPFRHIYFDPKGAFATQTVAQAAIYRSVETALHTDRHGFCAKALEVSFDVGVSDEAGHVVGIGLGGRIFSPDQPHSFVIGVLTQGFVIWMGAAGTVTACGMYGAPICGGGGNGAGCGSRGGGAMRRRSASLATNVS